MEKDNLEVALVDIPYICVSSIKESLLGIRLKVKAGLKVLRPQTWKWQQAGDATAQHELGLESTHTYRIYIPSSTLTRAPHHGINLSQLPLNCTTHNSRALSWKQFLLYREAPNASETRQNQLQLANNACNNCTVFHSIVILWLIRWTLWSLANDPWNILESSNISGAWRIIVLWGVSTKINAIAGADFLQSYCIEPSTRNKQTQMANSET